LAKSVQVGQSILCADGSLVLTVLSTDIPAGEITCRIENNASIGERKNMNLPGVLVELPTFTEKDIEGNLISVDDDDAVGISYFSFRIFIHSLFYVYFLTSIRNVSQILYNLVSRTKSISLPHLSCNERVMSPI
jgi:hypothetical protein